MLYTSLIVCARFSYSSKASLWPRLELISVKLELSMGIASFKSNRGLCKAELVARSNRELHSSVIIPNSSCFIYERSPPASNRVFGTLQSFRCDVVQCGPNLWAYIARIIQGLWQLNACTTEFENYACRLPFELRRTIMKKWSNKRKNRRGRIVDIGQHRKERGFWETIDT